MSRGRILPGRRIAGGAFVCLPHPAPMAERHLLVLPTRPYRNALELGDVGSLVSEVAALCAERSWPRMMLVTNLGSYQDVALLHFHVVEQTDGFRTRAAASASAPTFSELVAQARRERRHGWGARICISLDEAPPRYAELTITDG